MILSTLFLASGVSAAITASSSTTSIFDSSVPTNAPIPGDYTGALRPQIHFSPPLNFMNDPNGCFLDDSGLWHYYYQYNPTGVVAGNQHWGHASSHDLYHWENQKIAIFATEDSQIFSGSAVIDVNNTSGFFPNQKNGVVAIYTLNTPTLQVQEIAYSIDGGYTFTKYSGNPVLTVNSDEFRDPKVIRYGDHWVMVLAYAQDLTIGFFTSPDLKTWTHASNFTHAGLLGLQYECPNLVAIPVAGSAEIMYLLAISINPGAPLGGSITQYFPGRFNGTHFTPVDGAARIADFGKDNYAGQFFHNIPETEDQVFIGWANNWQYSQEVPTASEGWRSVATLPRKARLANVTRTGWDLISVPYGLEAVYDDELAKKEMGNGSLLLDYGGGSGALYFQVNVTGLNSSTATGTLNFTFTSSETKESVSGGFYFDGDFWLSRQKVLGFGLTNPFFTDKFSVSNPLATTGIFTLEVVIDRSILEAFLDGGRNSATTVFYPEGVLDTLEIRTSELAPGTSVSVSVRGLKSAWAAMAIDGIVYGNSTNATQAVRRDGM